MSEKSLDSIFSTLHFALILFPSCLCSSPNISLKICKYLQFSVFLWTFGNFLWNAVTISLRYSEAPWNAVNLWNPESLCGCLFLDFSTLWNHTFSLNLSDSQSLCLPPLIIISQMDVGYNKVSLWQTLLTHQLQEVACLLAQGYTSPSSEAGGEQMPSHQGIFSENQSQRKGPGIWSPSKEARFPGPRRTICVTLRLLLLSPNPVEISVQTARLL